MFLFLLKGNSSYFEGIKDLRVSKMSAKKCAFLINTYILIIDICILIRLSMKENSVEHAVTIVTQTAYSHGAVMSSNNRKKKSRLTLRYLALIKKYTTHNALLPISEISQC